MADINIKKKKKSIWPWILGLALALFGMWVILEILNRETGMEHVQTATRLRGDQPGRPGTVSAYSDDSDNDASNPETDPAATSEVMSDTIVMRHIHAFVDFVDNRDVSQAAEYTNDGIQYLADALDAYVSRYYADDKALAGLRQRMRRQADQIQKNGQDPLHADLVRDAFTTAAAMINVMQDQKHPDLEDNVNRVQKSAEDMNSGKALQEQQDEVKAYFNEASDALQAMTAKGYRYN